MQFKTLFGRILGRCAKNMRGMKGCTNIGSNGKHYAII
jgi:hypothetical protein